MKICILANTYSPKAIGGANVYLENISKKLAEDKHEVIVITINHEHDKEINIEENEKIKIYRFHPFNVSTFNHIAKRTKIEQGIWTALDIYNYYSYFQIKNILRRERPDIVHAHTPVDITLSGFNAVKDTGIPLVFTVHDYLLLCRRIVLLHANGEICSDGNINPLCRMYRSFARDIVNRTVDAVIAPSRFILDLYKKSGFFTRSSNLLLPYGIDLREAKESSVVNDTCKYGINILYVGSLTRHKGVDILIQAVRKIKNDKIKLYIVGEGVFGDYLKKVAAGDERIIFYGKVKNENIHKFYMMTDILVVPSLWYEVLGIVIQEAFRTGIPVAASRIGGITELVKDGYNGFLFEPGNVDQLTKILEDALANPFKLKKLGLNAQESIKPYELAIHMQKLTEVYEKAIEISKKKAN